MTRGGSLDTAPALQRLRGVDALRSRPGLSFLSTSGGSVRVRRQPCDGAPRFLFGADGPNVIEHYDALLAALEGRADVVVFEPPGTGASLPARDFDFSLPSYAAVTREVLSSVGARTLVFPCWLGFVAQEVARANAAHAPRLVLPQTSSWDDLGQWAQRVDPRRLVRTPWLGQLLVRVRRRQLARGWYAASTGAPRFHEPFAAASNEAFDFGGCFCLASLMQALERSPAPSRAALPVPTAVVWGARDRTHRRSNAADAVVGAELIRFDDCGHSPELEAPRRFTDWLLAWHGEPT